MRMLRKAPFPNKLSAPTPTFNLRSKWPRTFHQFEEDGLWKTLQAGRDYSELKLYGMSIIDECICGICSKGATTAKWIGGRRL
jgi:hypothetical protein